MKYEDLILDVIYLLKRENETFLVKYSHTNSSSCFFTPLYRVPGYHYVAISKESIENHLFDLDTLAKLQKVMLGLD